MAIVDCFGKQTPKGPNYNVTDKFAYQKGPEWKVGTAPRNTLDSKAKYEHYYRQDIDVNSWLMVVWYEWGRQDSKDFKWKHSIWRLIESKNEFM